MRCGSGAKLPALRRAAAPSGAAFVGWPDPPTAVSTDTGAAAPHALAQWLNGGVRRSAGWSATTVHEPGALP